MERTAATTEERRHCIDHSGTQENLINIAATQQITREELGTKIDKNFTILQWIIGFMVSACVGFGCYIVGVQTTLEKQVAINSYRITSIEKNEDKVDQLLVSIEMYLRESKEAKP
jgi:hypothetical protein